MAIVSTGPGALMATRPPPLTVVDELRAGRIDVTRLITGHPSATVADAIDRCGARIIPIAGSGITAGFAAGIDYVPAVIEARHHPALPADVPTYAVIATVVTREDADDSLVDNRNDLDLRAPVLAGLQPAQMHNHGLTAPLHPAAEAAFEAAPVGQ